MDSLAGTCCSSSHVDFASTAERNQPSRENRRRVKDRRSERWGRCAEPALPACQEKAEECSQNELSWLHSLDWREAGAGLGVDGAELPGESGAGWWDLPSSESQ